MWFSITPHSAHEASEPDVANLLSALHQANSAGEPLRLAIAGTGAGTKLLAKMPSSLKSLFVAAGSDLLPDCLVSREKVDEPGDRTFRRVVRLRLEPECFSIAREATRPVNDPAKALFSALRTGLSGSIQTRLDLRIRPSSPRRRQQAERLIGRMGYSLRPRIADWLYQWLIHRPGVWSGIAADILRLLLPCRRESVSKAKLESHLYECVVSVEVAGPPAARLAISSKLVDITGSLGAYTTDGCRFRLVSIRCKYRKSWRKSCLMTPAELSALWHPPSGRSRIGRVARSPTMELEPPCIFSSRPDSTDTVIGQVVYRNQKDRVTLSPSARMRHMFVIGKTGCGKSTLLQNMIIDDMAKGRGICLLDPHGDLTEAVLDFVPTRRTNDVLLLDAGDRERPVAFNPMATGGRLDPVLVADGVLTAFQNVFGFDAAQAPRLLHIFRNCLLSLVSHEDRATLIGVQRMLTDDSFRHSVVHGIENPAVRHFWTDEFARWRPADRTAFVASLQNKLGAYLSNPLLAGILGQSRNRLDFRQLMDDGRKIVLINLSKGRMGSAASSLLGSLIVSAIQTAALSRADLSESERREFYVYLDEFSSFVSEGNDTFASILAESRKYRTGYTLVTQFVQSLDEQTRAAVFGNCGTLIAMQCGIDDAQIMSNQLGDPLTAETITQLPRFHAYARAIVDGAPSRPFGLKTPPPPNNRLRRSTTVRRHSRQRHGRPRLESEAEIKKAYG